MHTGCPMHRVTRIPYQKQLSAGNYKLSKEARQRLKIIDWYRLKSMCGIDQYTRRPVVHISSSCSSNAGKTALQKIRQRFTKDIIIINDKGSENMSEAEQWLKEEQMRQYWCRPNKPKDKPFIERFIGTLQTECPAFHYEPMNVHEMQEIIDEWIFKYENQRPHEGLGFLTPKQFEAMFYAPKHSLVSYF